MAMLSFNRLNPSILVKLIPRNGVVFCNTLIAVDSKSQSSDGRDILSMEDIPGPKYGLGLTLWQLMKRGGLLHGILKYDRDLISEYGKILLKNVPSKQVVLSDPDAIAEVLHLADRNANHAYRPVMDLIRNVLNDHQKHPGLFFSNGGDWYRFRKAISQKMLRPISVASYADDISKICDTAIDAIKRERISDDTAENSLEILLLDKMLFRWSFESVASVLFGKRFGTLEESPSEEVLDFISSVGKFLGGIMKSVFIPRTIAMRFKPKPYQEFEKSLLKMFYYCEYFAGQRIKELELMDPDERNNSNSLLLHLLNNDSLTKEDVYTAMVDVFFAGVDTTSNTMLWVLYNLCKHPNALRRLKAEIDERIGGKKDILYGDLNNMPFLKATIKETLRLHPVVPVQQRVLDTDAVVMGYRIPAGTEFTLMTQAIGRMEEYFDDASQFIPDRWMPGNRRHNFHPYASIPFGHGTRMCAGRRVAELEIYMLVIKLIQNFDLSYPEEEIVKEKSRGVTIPDRPLRVKFKDIPST